MLLRCMDEAAGGLALDHLLPVPICLSVLHATAGFVPGVTSIQQDFVLAEHTVDSECFRNIPCLQYG